MNIEANRTNQCGNNQGQFKRQANLTCMSLGCKDHPCLQRKDTQTLYRKSQGRDSNRGPSCCKATVHTTATPPNVLRYNFTENIGKQGFCCLVVIKFVNSGLEICPVPIHVIKTWVKSFKSVLEFLVPVSPPIEYKIFDFSCKVRRHDTCWLLAL